MRDGTDGKDDERWDRIRNSRTCNIRGGHLPIKKTQKEGKNREQFSCNCVSKCPL